jgi:hypothetical protein
MQALGKPPDIPAGWYEMFSWESLPDRVPDDHWPTLANVIHHLQDQHQRMRRIIAGLGPAQLDQPAAGNPDYSVRYAVLHALHDEACHSGEMHLLRKLQAVDE